MSTGLMPLFRWSSREVLSSLVLIKGDDFHKLRGSGVFRRTSRCRSRLKILLRVVIAKTRHVHMTVTCNPTRTSITDSFIFSQCGDETADDMSNKLYGHHFGTYPRGRRKSGCQLTERQGSGQTCGQLPLFPRTTFSELLLPLQSYRNVTTARSQNRKRLIPRTERRQLTHLYSKTLATECHKYTHSYPYVGPSSNKNVIHVYFHLYIKLQKVY